MMTDPISDMLTRIRNAAMVKAEVVTMPLSQMKFALAKILESEGFLQAVSREEQGGRPILKVELRYEPNGSPRVSDLKRISKPGRRVYVKATELTRVRSGFGIAILSTPNGLMTSDEAKKRHLGGELICEIY
jgi:small subunit ribosomal protein S8